MLLQLLLSESVEACSAGPCIRQQEGERRTEETRDKSQRRERGTYLVLLGCERQTTTGPAKRKGKRMIMCESE